MKQFIFLIFLFFFSTSLFSQICDGNLGENIFEAGDFGSGADNVLLTDPGIAPGYTYTTTPPPFDGLYSLSNNTGQWSGNFGTWLDIPDNSSDPEGYMMIVNASFEPGLFYEQEVDDLCENTLYEFTADVINLIRAGVADHIKPNVSFLIDGAVQYSTGDIPQNENWNTYGFVFTTAPGQTSIVLSLQNNAPGGIGNDLALDNITFQPCGPLAQILPDAIESICEDGAPTELEATVTGSQYDTPAFQWQQSFNGGITWVDIAGANAPTYVHTDLSSGLYYYRYYLANGPLNLTNSKCRVVSNIKIVEVVPKFWNITDTLCEGLVYISGNDEYTETGIFVDSLTSSIGCDSIVTLDLTFLPGLGIAADFLVENPLCSDDPTGSITVENLINVIEPVTYFIDGEISINGPLLTDLIAGEYLVGIEDNIGCTYDSLVEVIDPVSLMIDLGEDQVVDLGEQVSINLNASEPIAFFSWSPEIGDCEPACLDFDFFPTLSSYYTLTAVSDTGCIAIDSIYIQVNEVRKVYIPNVFSPNFDGTNDYFTPYAAIPNVTNIQSLRVFNRWGAVVYEQFNFQPNSSIEGWNGTFKGKPVDDGVYVYLMEIEFLDGKVINYSGNVTLVK